MKRYILSKNIDRSLTEYRKIRGSLNYNHNSYLTVAIQDTPSCIEVHKSRHASEYYEISHYEYGTGVGQTRLWLAINNKLACILNNHQVGNTSAAGIISEIKLRQGPPEDSIFIANIYIRPQAGYHDTVRLLNQLAEKCRGKLSKMMILGDVNASSTLWDPDHDQRNEEALKGPKYHQTKIQRGLTISEFVRRNGMEVLQQKTGLMRPTYRADANSRGAYIDICIVGEKIKRIWSTLWIAPCISKEVWPSNESELNENMFREPNTGHQHLIITNKSHTTKNPQQIRGIRCLKTSLMLNEHFIPLRVQTRELRENWRRNSRAEIISRLEKLTDLTVTAIEISQLKATITKKTNNNNGKHIQDIIRRIQRLKKKQMVRRKNMRKRYNQISYFTIKNTRRKDRIMRKTKDKLLRQLMQRVKGNPNELWTRIQRVKNAKHTEETTNTGYTQNEINRLAEELFPEIDRQLSNKALYAYKPTLLTQQEILTAKKLTKNKKYAGPDGISFRAFNRSLELIPDIIFDIARMSYYSCHIPEHCHLTHGTIIPKKAPGKYRIVHVATPLAAFLEVIALNRFQYALEIGKLYNPNQYGFRAGRGRDELVSRIITSITRHRQKIQGDLGGEEYIKNNQTTIDISGAFDNVAQGDIADKLLNKLSQEGVAYWIKEFMINRKIAIKHKGMTSYYREVCKGVPQGSALGPLLWNFAIEDLDDQVYEGNRETMNTMILAYADDLTVISHGHQQEVTEDTLLKIVNYMKQKGLEINSQKSEMMTILGPGSRP